MSTIRLQNTHARADDPALRELLADAVVRADDPGLRELLANAEHCAVMTEPRGMVASARATVRAIRGVIGWDDAKPAIKALRK